MDTHRTFWVKNISDFPDKLEIEEPDQETQIALEHYVSFFETIQNVHQLYEVFVFNLEQLQHFCTVYYNDVVIRSRDGKSATLIEINALFINVISAGKTLAEAIDKIVGLEMMEAEYTDFRNDVTCKQYDEVFSYRFCYYLRNYAQHGNLPISKNLDNRFCFDLEQIIKTQHISPSKSIKESMKKVYYEIVEIKQTEPYIAFTYTLDCYTLSVMRIYYEFFRALSPLASSLYHNKNEILENNPILIHHGDGVLDGMVIYKIEDDIGLHMFSARENAWNMYVEFQNEAKIKLKYYQDQHYKGTGN